MRNRLRVLLWLFALGLALALVWSRARILLVVQANWLQLVAIILVIAGIIYLLLHYILDRLER